MSVSENARRLVSRIDDFVIVSYRIVSKEKTHVHPISFNRKKKLQHVYKADYLTYFAIRDHEAKMSIKCSNQCWNRSK